VIGVGNIGRAVLHSRGLEKSGIHIAAGFDIDPAKYKREDSPPVLPLEDLVDLVRTREIRLGVIAVPVFDKTGPMAGVLYGGRVINRDFTLVDRVRDMVFGEDMYNDKPVGTVTILQDDVRISTNVQDEGGQRAVGTRVSDEVHDAVIEQGRIWHERALVVTDWYKTAYEPIRDIDGKIIGILYVGTLEQPFVDMARRIFLFFQRGDFDMLSVSPFIPHPQTPLAGEPAGDLLMTLKMIALTRIVSRDAHIPAGTAIGSLHGRDERPRALAAGANVLMPSFTPGPYRRRYEIYPGKRCVDEEAGACLACLEHMLTAAGRKADYSRGDSLKSCGFPILD
jgi:hypothetical protein